MNWKLVLPALGAVIVVTGCGGKKAEQTKADPKVTEIKLKPGEESTLMPLQLGNEWTYSLENTVEIPGRTIPPRTASVTFKVTSSQPTADGLKATLDVSQGDKVIDKQVWESSKRGIYQYTSGMKQVPFSPPMPNVLFPLDKNKTFKWQGTGIQMGETAGTGKVEYTVIGSELVDTDQGPMSALCVQCLGSFTVKGKPGVQRSVSWWCPNFGLVRYFSQAVLKGYASTTVLRLKHYTPGK